MALLSSLVWADGTRPHLRILPDAGGAARTASAAGDLERDV
ncbi:hypothetical protein ACFHW2_25060 [Actinomadura sp. LOL_016]